MKTETPINYYDKVVNLATATLLEELLDKKKKMKKVVITTLGNDDEEDVAKMIERGVLEKLHKIIDLLK